MGYTIQKNNKLNDAIRKAGWTCVKDFCTDFNLPLTTIRGWSCGWVRSIFTAHTDKHVVYQLCKIFDCSEDDLNNMVFDAWKVRNRNSKETPLSPIDNKLDALNRFYAKPVISNNETDDEIPLGDFLVQQGVMTEEEKEETENSFDFEPVAKRKPGQRQAERNNKFKNAMYKAGWNNIRIFCEDCNLNESTIRGWSGGASKNILSSRTDRNIVLRVCKIFDCSDLELNDLVVDAYNARHDKNYSEPERADIGDKEATLNKVNKSDIEEEIEASIPSIPLNSDENLDVEKPIVLGEHGMDREDIVDHILDEAYGKIPYSDFISLGNVLHDWAQCYI